jgi:outer membrane lipoprotein carrier protein
MAGIVIVLLGAVILPVSGHTEASRVTENDALSPTSSLNDILEKIEQRYAAPGFTADFIQESTLKMMQITDYARGTASFQRPGMMRWEYETPERQLIITNGQKLWIYKPDEKQVMLGKTVSLFIDGSGAEFLSDIKLLREKFRIEKLPSPDDTHIALKLIPKKKTVDLAFVIINVLKKTQEVVCITSYNAYGDETKIRLFNIRFHQTLDNERFHFTIPSDVDLLYLDDE